MERYVKIVIYITVCLCLHYSTVAIDDTFGIFQYEGSRLKRIDRFIGEKMQHIERIEYSYDTDGYLIGRTLLLVNKSGRFYLAYESVIEYDFEENHITEYFDRYINNNRISPIYYEYYYDETNKLIRYLRKNKNRKTGNFDISYNISIQYNFNNDITFIGADSNMIINNAHFPGYGWLSSIGFLNSYNKKEHVYEYIYSSDLIERYSLLSEEKKYKYFEYIFENKQFTQLLNYFANNEKSSRTIINRNKKGNITSTTIISYLLNNTHNVNYIYDVNNRLVQRTIYYPDSIVYNRIQETEKYTYENGEYMRYQYLLPEKKIIIYQNANDPYIDRKAF